MTQSLKEIAVAAAGILFLYLALFSRIAIKNSLFLIIFLLPVVLNVVGWRRWNGVRHDGSTARWRRTAGLLGLAASTLAVVLACVVFGVFATATARFVRTADHPPVPWINAIDLGLVARVCIALSAAALLAGTVAPVRIRLVVAFSGLTLACLVGSIR
jgi:hypothetical protein